jgi:hypothetical protein
MDMKVMPVEKQESYHAYIARRYRELEENTWVIFLILALRPLPKTN